MSLDFLHLSNNNLRSSGMHELICLLLKGRRVGSLPLKSHPQPMFEIIVRFRRLKAVPKLWESHYNRKGRKKDGFPILHIHGSFFTSVVRVCQKQVGRRLAGSH